MEKNGKNKWTETVRNTKVLIKIKENKRLFKYNLEEKEQLVGHNMTKKWELKGK